MEIGPNNTQSVDWSLTKCVLIDDLHDNDSSLIPGVSIWRETFQLSPLVARGGYREFIRPTTIQIQ